mgnify:CR=1 FL=1
MPLAMRKKVFITAALTGSGGTQDRSDKVPRSPEQIANDAIEAAKAGAAVVHCHKQGLLFCANYFGNKSAVSLKLTVFAGFVEGIEATLQLLSTLLTQSLLLGLT